MDELSRTLYSEIRHVAAGALRRERERRSLSPTDLAHEAMARAIRSASLEDVPRAEVLRRVARLCRQVLVDRARARSRLRRGGGRRPLALEVDPESSDRLGTVDVLAVDEALEALAALDARHASIVELRFFGGLSMPEIAEALEVSLSAVEKEWRKARAWLALYLERDA